MGRCNDKGGGKQNGRDREAKDKQRGEKLIYGGIEEEIEKKRQTDRKRKGDIGSKQMGWGWGLVAEERDGSQTISGEM